MSNTALHRIEMPTQATSAAAPMHDTRRGRLFRRYLVLILTLVTIALLASGVISVYFTYQETKSALAALQHEKALAAASRIEQYILQIERQLDYAALPQLDASNVELRRIEFLKLLRQAPEVTDVAQLDATGHERLAVSRLGMDSIGSGRDRSQEAAFREAKTGRAWFGPVYFRKETEPYMTIAIRGAGTGGLTLADVNLKFIWDVVSRIRIGDKGKAYVVDDQGYLVAAPDIGLVLRKTNLAALPHVRAAATRRADGDVATVSTNLAGTRVLTAVAPIDSLKWNVFVEQPVSEVYAKLNASILRTGLLLLAGLVISALGALALARGMVRPIRTLEEGAQRIGAGDLDQRIDIRTGDELEALAAQFNRMSGQLRESYAGLEQKVAERTQELENALQQQTAISEILRVISSSPTDVQPVFDTIAASALGLCDAVSALVFTFDGKLIHLAANANVDPQAESAWRRAFPRPPSRETTVARALLTGQVAMIPDVLDDPDYAVGDMAVDTGFRSTLAVPLIRDGTPIGAIGVGRPHPGAFGEHQIAILQTFADQAVIAIENVRLFNETKEALQQQTAVAEILRVISASPTDVQPVLEAIAERAARLCDASAASMYLIEDDALRHLASRGPSPDPVTHVASLPIDGETITSRAVLERRTIQVEDLLAAADEYPRSRAIAQQHGHRTVVVTPLLREGQPFGAILLRRNDVHAFSEREIALLRTFGDQAAIALENVRLFREIEEKSRQLEVANKHKSEFLANMSHELRTPLNAIIGFSEVLLERLFGDLNDKQDDYLKDIHSSGKHLLSLINDILDLSKIEAGRMELEPSPVDVASAISNALTLVRERAQHHGITLAQDVDPALHTVEADERKFKQILLNLLSNAVKFTPDGGRIDVTARRTGDVAQIAVRDTGIGIAPEHQAAVFEEFRQVGRDYTRKQEGTGLGLALTRRFVELHGGTIRLESAPGAGSTFTFTLPLSR